MKSTVDLAEGIQKRRAIRKFKPTPIPRKLLKSMFDLAKWSPVASIFKVWDYTVVEGEARDRVANCICQNTTLLRDILSHATPDMMQKAIEYYRDVGGAPVIVVVTMPQTRRAWDRKMTSISFGTELQTLLLAAFYLGLGACPVTMPPWVENETKKVLRIDESRDIVTAIALGYPDESPEPVPREAPTVRYVK